MVKTEGVIISANSATGQFGLLHNPSFFFSVGLIPILVFILMKIAKSNSIKHSIVVTGILILSGLILWQIRVQLLISHFEKLSNINNLVSEEIFSEYNIENLRFGNFLALGILIGIFVSMIYLKVMNGKRMVTSSKNP